MINPMKLMQLKNAWSRFEENHPKFPKFVTAIQQKGVREGTVFEFKVTTPEGEEMVSNLKLTAGDMELFRELSEMMK